MTLTGQDNLPAVQTCLKDVDSIQSLANQMLAAFKKKDLNDIGKGITLLGAAMAQVEADVNDCAAMKDTDWPRIEKWLSVIKDQKKFMKLIKWNVFIHQGKIISDISTMESDGAANKP